MSKRFLIIGGGSMGKRRIRCLLANGINPNQIRLVEVREDRREQVKQDYDVDSFTDFDDGMAWDPDAVLVSVPGALHMRFCVPAAAAGKHVFCEVPLSVDLNQTDELQQTVKKQGLVLAPGCQVLFDPLAQKIKSWIEDPAFGRALIYQETFGAYLPSWHPYEDYRSFYAADQNMGGGNLDVIAQELTVARWMTGHTVDSLFAQGSHLSELEINGHDCQQILARSNKGMVWTLQYDLIQHPGGLSRKIVGERGTLEVQGTTIRRYLADTEQWETWTRPEDIPAEQPYIDEIAHFLRCIDGQDQWPVSLDTAIDVIRFLLAMRQSIETGQPKEIDHVAACA